MKWSVNFLAFASKSKLIISGHLRFVCAAFLFIYLLSFMQSPKKKNQRERVKGLAGEGGGGGLQ